jgi:outer membrane protein
MGVRKSKINFILLVLARIPMSRFILLEDLGQKAKKYFLEVKESNPPSRVVENIDKFLALIENNKTPKNWRVYGSLGWMHDTNANAGPEAESVLMFGLPFTLSDTAKERSDNAWLVRLGFNHANGLNDDVSWISSLTLNSTDYNSIDSLDSLVLSGSSGPSWRIDEQTTASLSLVADLVKIGHENSYYNFTYGVAPQIQYKINKKTSANLNTTISKKNFKTQRARNSRNYTINPTIGYQIDKTSFSRLGLMFAREDSGISYYSNDSIGINSSYGYTFQNGLQTYLNASYTDSDYKGQEIYYSETRHDKISKFLVNTSYHIEKLDSDIVLSANYTDNDSNLDMYKYNRQQISLSVRKSF